MEKTRLHPLDSPRRPGRASQAHSQSMPSTATQVSVALAAGLGLSSAFAPPGGVALRVATTASGARRNGVVSLRATTETIRRRGSSSERPRGDESLLRDLHTTTLKRAFAAPASDKKPLSKSGHPYETGAFGEIDYDAPSAKLKAAGRLNVNQSPPAVHSVFDNEIDIDAPMSRQIAARGFEGRGHFKFETGAFCEIDYDAPSAKLKAAGRLSVNQPPSAVHSVFDNEIDYDAPIVRQIAARGYEGVGGFFLPGRGHFQVETGAFGEIGTNSQKASEWLYIVNLYISEHTRALTLRIINDLHQTTTPRLPSSRLPGA